MLLFLSLQKMETVFLLMPGQQGEDSSPTWLRNVTGFSVIVANLK